VPGRYQLVKKLASGGMAEVFLARAAGPGGFEKTLVVKRILPQLAEREAVVRMFFSEARIAAQLTHPNIVQIFDFGEDEGAYFIAMEFVDGITLRTLSKWATATGPLAPTICAKLVSLAAEGLGWAHDFASPETGEPLGLVHRDVSADNIMVSRTGAVKVLDFGVARVAGEDNGTQAGMLKGKISYMPREQILGDPLDGRVDVYALGVVLYLLLTGQRPYEKASEVALMNAILTGAPRPLTSLRADVPASLVAIVQRAMAQERELRFQSCHELQHALEQYLASERAVVTTAVLGQLVSQVREALSGGEERGAPGSRSGAGSKGVANSGVHLATPLATRSVVSAPAPTLDRAVAASGDEPATSVDAPRQTDWVEGFLGGSGAGGGFRAEPIPVARPSAPPVLAPGARPPPAGPEVSPSRPSQPGQVHWQPTPAPFPSLSPESLRKGVAPPGRPSSSAWQLTPIPFPVAPLSDGAPRPSAPPPAGPPAGGGLQTPARGFEARPSAPHGPPASPSFSGLPPAASAPFALRPGPLVGGALATWATAPTRGQPTALLSSLRAAVTSDRLASVRRFFLLASRHLNGAQELAPWIAWHAGGVLAAVQVAEDHGTLGWLAQRAAGQQAEGSPFGGWVRGQLSGPRTWMLLVEQLRRGLPDDVRSLEAWIGALGAPAVPVVMWAIEQLEAGAAQDLLCRTLASTLGDPTPVIQRLEVPNVKHVAAWAQVLERHLPLSERQRVFAKVLSRRDIPLTLAVMTGRARAGGADGVQLLELALGDRLSEVRLKALELMTELGDARVARVLMPHFASEQFDERPEAERVALVEALASSSDPVAVPLVLERFAEKANLLNRKRLAQRRLPMVEGLGRAKGAAARQALELLSADPGQPDEVRAAAAARLSASEVVVTNTRLPPEQMVRLRRLVVLELLTVVRGALALDLAAGQLDAAIGRLCGGVRQVVAQEGRFEFSVTSDGVLLNGVPVPFVFCGGAVSQELAQAFTSCDVRSLRVDGPVQPSALRAAVLQLTDPEGTPEASPRVQVMTWSGRLVQPVSPQPLSGDGGARSAELVARALAFVREQRPNAAAGHFPPVVSLEPLLRSWVTLATAGAWRVLAVAPTDALEPWAVHAVNTACIATAFGAELQLDEHALWELAELGLLFPLGEASVPASSPTPPGLPLPEERRLRVGLFFLAQLKHRRGPSAAVTALEAGLARSANVQVRGPGVVATILSMAEAWDALAQECGRGHAAAFEVLAAKHSERFAPELFRLFATWAIAQRA
jgi:hypothetical protein